MVPEDVLDEGCVDVGEATAAELLGPGHPDPAGLAERARDLARVAVGEHSLTTPLRIGFQLRAERDREGRRLLPQRDLPLGQPEIHPRAIVEAS